MTAEPAGPPVVLVENVVEIAEWGTYDDWMAKTRALVSALGGQDLSLCALSPHSGDEGGGDASASPQDPQETDALPPQQ